MAHRFRLAATTAALTLLAAAGSVAAAAGDDDLDLLPGLTFPSGIRFATFNVSLNRPNAGDLTAELQSGVSAQAATIAQIIQRSNPDVLLLNEFDHDDAGAAIAAFRQFFLAASQDGAVPSLFDHVFIAPSNTGIPSGFDLNNDGTIGGPDDAFGFGFHPGQFGMVVLSKYPILTEQVRTFQTFLWKDMPGALLPDDPKTPEPADWFSPEELEVVRLSSKSHWDVPVDIDGEIVHVLAAHPTPPVFDGPEDRNGRRNHDEIHFWVDYVTPGAGDYIVDDAGVRGGIAPGARFVVMGDQNADPFDGDSTMNAARQLTDSPLFNTSITPSAAGGISAAAIQGGANDDHLGAPSQDTADFADGSPGNLRVDYALPSADLPLVAAGVFWPVPGDGLFPLVGEFPFPSSDHRLVWVDLAIAGSSLPGGVAAGDVTATSAVLWAGSTVRGEVRFEWSLDSSFATIEGSATAVVLDPLQPAKVVATGLRPATTWYHRAIDAAGATASGTFRTAAAPGTSAGLRIGITGDWRGELAPYPAIANMAQADLDVVVALGDTIYADFASPVLPGVDQAETIEQFRLKYTEVYGERFGRNFWRDVRGSTATYATIDDHEVTNDFAGGADPASDPRFAGQSGAFINETSLYRNGLEAFHDHHPIAVRTWAGTGDPRLDGKPKLYRAQRFGDDAILIVTDARSFRDQGLPPVVDPNNLEEIAAFLFASFDPTRTMLGEAQVQQLLDDLLAAQQDGVRWKFVIVPEPIQNLGVIAASDRFEGYAAERTRILSFIAEQDIQDVVFVCADIHGTVVNDVRYQGAPFGPQIETGAFEISTGSVAFDAPFGPTVAQLGLAAGLLTPEQFATYLALPRFLQDAFIEELINVGLAPLGYPAVGLNGDAVDASLVAGGWTATHTYGWTQFDIDADSGRLTVSTYGIEPYSQAELFADPDAVIARQPELVQQFVVFPGGGCRADADGDGAVGFSDLLVVLAGFGESDPAADVVPDGTVDFQDILFVLGAFGPCP
jgi:phosphodiesterase/alkaline phosphatase D-like protein